MSDTGGTLLGALFGAAVTSAATIYGASIGYFNQAQTGQVSIPVTAASFGKEAVSDISKRTSINLRPADGSETDCRVGIHLAREAHLRTIFRDIPSLKPRLRQS
ncbi:hypothetical protein FMN63_28905 [Stappia sp. BW2]|uniref:hypothetical protein n=1 Tax=Stappia sp. BW2 TaxID=2592622 RepID=UPI0011DEE32C|nr:hypothetical protein [Stappia sp. BW2]TYC63077.1 hypothetical protein FMN63_28905 [Stappia sp. BW2]